MSAKPAAWRRRSRPSERTRRTSCCSISACPGRNGMDLLAELQGKGSTFPILILSSRTDEAGIVQALELGADDYITKPFGMKEVIARLRVAIRHRLQQQGERPIFQVGGTQGRSRATDRDGA